MTDVAALIDAILARGSLTLSAQERAALETAPGDLRARRILGADAFNTGDWARAVEITAGVHAAAPTAESAANYIAALSRANRLDEALAFTEAAAQVLREVTRASYMSELHGRLGNREENRAWSLRALELKEAEAPVLEDRPAPRLARFDPETPARNIISYSLFGAQPRYLEGALRNAIVARHLYPGWTPRFYIDDIVPMETRRALEREGAQLKQVPNLPAHRYGLFWRFLVEDDPDVDLYLVRDADSVPSIREAVAVADWLASGQPFHVMRDFHTHSELVLAGLWGAHRGNIPGLGKRILAFARTREKVLNSRVDDQLFLRREAWPFMRGRTFVQDSAFGYGATGEFDARFALPRDMHVGQDDSAARTAKRRR